MSEVGLSTAMASPRCVHQRMLVKSKDGAKSIDTEVKGPESYRVCWALAASGTDTGLSEQEAIRQQAGD